MILVVGIPTEAPLALAIEAAEKKGIDCVVFNQRHATFNDLVVDYKNGQCTGTLYAWGREFSLESFTGIYARMIDVASLPEFKPTRTQMVDRFAFGRANYLTDTLRRWIEVAPCRVLNRCAAMASNGSKPYQAQLINQVGLKTPTTLITNDPDQARDFANDHGEVIFKSISGVRSIVKRLTPDRLNDLDKIRSLPTQFQAFVPGTNVRVHVIGEQVFATEIQSEAVDYRYGSREGLDTEMTPYDLPADIREKCVALSQTLELPLCGIDFKRTPDDDFVCFEVNPSPAYSYYEQHGGQPISSAIVDYLAG